MTLLGPFILSVFLITTNNADQALSILYNLICANILSCFLRGDYEMRRLNVLKPQIEIGVIKIAIVLVVILFLSFIAKYSFLDAFYILVFTLLTYVLQIIALNFSIHGQKFLYSISSLGLPQLVVVPIYKFLQIVSINSDIVILLIITTLIFTSILVLLTSDITIFKIKLSAWTLSEICYILITIFVLMSAHYYVIYAYLNGPSFELKSDVTVILFRCFGLGLILSHYLHQYYLTDTHKLILENQIRKLLIFIIGPRIIIYLIMFALFMSYLKFYRFDLSFSPIMVLILTHYFFTLILSSIPNVIINRFGPSNFLNYVIRNSYVLLIGFLSAKLILNVDALIFGVIVTFYIRISGIFYLTKMKNNTERAYVD